ncbi:HypC/HybG/HupF family hydrogenase formation chaperone [Streptosporangium sp. CA-135522]|uniref:HypC/HybG/HupF family hydrogenase formation chaperone n=1 Tax=Streptosporangium sp. CA-135522 TaxID=3240072 RepID=UPI003D945876
MNAREPLGAGEVPPADQCHGDACVTCSDEAMPVTVVRLLEAGLAVVDTGRGAEEVSVALVDAQVGDTVLVHAKEAIAVVKGVNR